MRSLAEVLERLGKLRRKRRLQIDVHAWLAIEHKQGILVFLILIVFSELVDKVCPEIFLSLVVLVLWSNRNRVSEDALEGKGSNCSSRDGGGRKEDWLWSRLLCLLWHQPRGIGTARLHLEVGAGWEGWGEQVVPRLDRECGQEDALLPLLQLLLHRLKSLVGYQAWLLLKHL